MVAKRIYEIGDAGTLTDDLKFPLDVEGAPEAVQTSLATFRGWIDEQVDQRLTASLLASVGELGSGASTSIVPNSTQGVLIVFDRDTPGRLAMFQFQVGEDAFIEGITVSAVGGVDEWNPVVGAPPVTTDQIGVGVSIDGTITFSNGFAAPINLVVTPGRAAILGELTIADLDQIPILAPTPNTNLLLEDRGQALRTPLTGVLAGLDVAAAARAAVRSRKGDRVNALDFAVGDGQIAAVTTLPNGSAALATAGAPAFVAGDVTKPVLVTNGISATAPATVLSTTIQSRQGANAVTLVAVAGRSYAGGTVYWGTNDLAALRAAWAAADGRTFVAPPAVYMLGDFGVGVTNIFDAAISRPRRVLMDGAIFVLNSTAILAEPVFFAVGDGHEDFRAEGGTVIDLGADPTLDGVSNTGRRGVYGLNITNPTLPVKRISWVGARIEGAHSGFLKQYGTARGQQIAFGSPDRPCYVQDAIYGAVPNACDGVHLDLHGKATRRAAYYNGCRGFTGNLVGENHRPSTAMVLINADTTQGPTKHGDIRIRCIGDRDNSLGAGLTAPTVHFSSVDASDATLLEDVHAHIHDTDDANCTQSVVVTGYDGASAIQATTSKVFRNLRVSGRLKGAVVLESAFTAEPRLEFDDAAWPAAAGLLDSKGAVLVHGRAREKVFSGGLSGGTIGFDLSGLAATTHQRHARLVFWARIASGGDSQTARQTWNLLLRFGGGFVLVEHSVKDTVELSSTGAGSTGLVDPGFAVSQTGATLLTNLSVDEPAGSLLWRNGVMRVTLEV